MARRRRLERQRARARAARRRPAAVRTPPRGGRPDGASRRPAACPAGVDRGPLELDRLRMVVAARPLRVLERWLLRSERGLQQPGLRPELPELRPGLRAAALQRLTENAKRRVEGANAAPGNI